MSGVTGQSNSRLHHAVQEGNSQHSALVTRLMLTMLVQALHNVHVNIIDLLDSRRQGTQVQVFATRQKLVSYTRATENIFPKTKAKENVLIKILLRAIY